MKHDLSERRYRSTSTWKSLEKTLRKEDTVCYLCGGMVFVNTPHGYAYSPVIEHIVPISRGGDPMDRDNVALCHYVCNSKKGDKLLSELDLDSFMNPYAEKVEERSRRKRTWQE